MTLVEIKIWVDGIKVVRISDAGDKFREWLSGQTVPFLENDPDPMDWAYYHDYLCFIQELPIID